MSRICHISRLHLNCSLVIAKNKINLCLRGSAPIIYRIIEVGIMAVRVNFMIDKMLKGFAKSFTAGNNCSALKEMICYTDIKIIKLWREDHPALWLFLV